MKFSLSKNPVVTLLSHFTGQPPDNFKCENWVPYFKASSKPEVWHPFFLPVNTVVAWHNFDLGFAAPYDIEIETDYLQYTVWKKGKFTLHPIKK